MLLMLPPFSSAPHPVVSCTSSTVAHELRFPRSAHHPQLHIPDRRDRRKEETPTATTYSHTVLLFSPPILSLYCGIKEAFSSLSGLRYVFGVFRFFAFFFLNLSLASSLCLYSDRNHSVTFRTLVSLIPSHVKRERTGDIKLFRF